MKVNRSITITDADISPLLEDLDSIMDMELTGVDAKSQEGHEISKKYPTLFKLHTLLKSEVMKEQSTYNYERIPG